MTENIFPDRDKFLERPAKEHLLKQHGLVIWFTGLSGAGKSTLAIALERKLYAGGLLTQVLDGDKIRNGLNNNLGFTEEERIENIRRIAEVSKLFSDCGVVAISAFISPTDAIRSMARNIIGNQNFFEVYVSTPVGICEQRDPKGLYKKARAGIIKNFTGISAPYEAPADANLVIDTTDCSVEEAAEVIFGKVFSLIKEGR
ncbi:MAG: adenylyl-sulfate kinase [Bacteroidales bacterium]|jgi:adenylylsulfate kinase